uniref:Uncharacterized protein n=1 Tax=Panagrolaimus sp. JU765 TaxID=591449 RepID=A0AC34PYC3_9BILA
MKLAIVLFAVIFIAMTKAQESKNDNVTSAYEYFKTHMAEIDILSKKIQKSLDIMRSPEMEQKIRTLSQAENVTELYESWSKQYNSTVNQQQEHETRLKNIEIQMDQLKISKPSNSAKSTGITTCFFFSLIYFLK